MDPIPTNLEEAVTATIARFPPDNLSYITNPESHPSMVHQTVGAVMRNLWNLWDVSPLKSYFVKTYGLGSADDISGAVLHATWQQVRGEPVDISGYVQQCKDHWAAHHIDPVSGGRLLTAPDQTKVVLTAPGGPVRGHRLHGVILDEFGSPSSN